MYYFGDSDSELQNHVFMSSNSGDRAHSVHEPLPGKTLEDSKTSFGLIHPTGNVTQMSAEGNLHDGGFDDGKDRMQSTFKYYRAKTRVSESAGFRLAEEL
jgi:hypothetical protein